MRYAPAGRPVVVVSPVLTREPVRCDAYPRDEPESHDFQE
ncbi:hypothetical protein SGL43_03198 [Streptomyces globisporus]|uniref:Uncharacterized protein n=1 Tax=Streptomyces globisporus TaxID=1908 RepID=A0ABM9GXT0_STRGL|nr:hypothetical protein SGL43_03198 [Streptomyces globisporus]